jgi:hypothetical protein
VHARTLAAELVRRFLVGAERTIEKPAFVGRWRKFTLPAPNKLGG